MKFWQAMKALSEGKLVRAKKTKQGQVWVNLSGKYDGSSPLLPNGIKKLLNSEWHMEDIDKS